MSAASGSGKPFMKPAKLEVLIWVLIFGGLLMLSLSQFIDPAAQVLVWTLALLGGCAAVAGFGLIYVRSRMQPDRQ